MGSRFGWTGYQAIEILEKRREWGWLPCPWFSHPLEESQRLPTAALVLLGGYLNRTDLLKR